MATVGQALTAPEAGWKRLNDAYPQFAYTKMAYTSGSGVPNAYNTDIHASATSNPGNVKFDFIGTKLRIIGLSYNAITNFSVSIDGVVEAKSYSTAAVQYQTLVYEKTGLTNTRHSVVVTHVSGQEMDFDAIDIDSTGRLMHPDEVTDLKDLVVGKRIRSHYVASSGAVGPFSGIGAETSDFIPAASSATPNGDFYIVHVDNDIAGRRILFSDRNVQHSIYWDTLNTAGIASGSGVEPTYQLPISMTANNAPAPYVATASGTYSNNGYLPYMSFDSVVGNGWLSSDTKLGNGLDWVQVDLGKETDVSHYYLNPSVTGDGGTHAGSWKLQGSNDGVNFTELHQASGGANTFKLANPAKYRYYRWVVMSTVGTAGQWTGIGDIKLYSSLIDKDYIITVRLPTGGTVAADPDNEWDRYIVTSTLNDTIVAGDNNIWHWNGQYSLSSTSTSAASRSIRGYSAANTFYTGGYSSSTLTSTLGFRPVFIIESLSSIKYLIKDTEGVKTVANGAWMTVTTGAPTEVDFQTKGMSEVGTIPQNLISLLKSPYDVLAFCDLGAPPTKAVLTLPPVTPLNVLGDKPEIITWTNDTGSPKHDLSITGSLVAKYRYRVDLDGSPPVPLKDWSAFITTDVTDFAILPMGNITQATNPYSISVSVEQSDGVLVKKSGLVTLIDTEPTLIVTMQGNKLHVTAGDPDSDRVQFQVKLNGSKVHPEGAPDFTDLMPVPIDYERVFRSDEINIGNSNVVDVTALDEYGKSSTISYTFVGDYSGMMFADEYDSYYSTDTGLVLQMLDMGILIAGQTSFTFPVKLINKNPFKVSNIILTSDESLMQGYTDLQFSITDSPFVAEQSVTYDSSVVLDYNQSLMFFVRVETGVNTAAGTGQFDILVSADPVV